MIYYNDFHTIQLRRPQLIQ